MRAARAEHTLLCLSLPMLGWLAGWLVLATASAGELPEAICQYRTLEIDEHTQEILFVAPEKIGPEDCVEAGAATGGPSQAWREQLPPRVQWRQHAQAAQLCQSRHSELGQRIGLLSPAGCVFLQARQVCTIMAAQALSHAQLANAVRQCVP